MTNLHHRMTKKAVGIVLILVSLLSALVCSIITNLPTANATQAHAILTLITSSPKIDVTHQPVGAADLKWDTENRTLDVTINLTGLAPSSSHPAHIHKGTCANDNGVLDPLKDVKADTNGIGTSTTTGIAGITKDLLTKGLFINVHNGPTLSPSVQKHPIACVSIPQFDLSKDKSQTLTFKATDATDQSITGTATLTLVDSTHLKVVVTLKGIDQFPHETHLHKGSCEKQGPVYQTLNKSQIGTTTTTLTLTEPHSSLPHPLYVNVHLATNDAELKTQTGFDPIVCGNLTT